MVVITDIRVPAGQFALGRLLAEYPDVEIELEKLVPLREGIIPMFWVSGAAVADVEETLRDDPVVRQIELLTETEGRYLFEAVWGPEVDALVQPLVESGAEVLTGEGTADRWEFRLQFRSRAELAKFRRSCQERDVEFDLLALYNPVMPDEHGPLTAEQEDALLTAYENGYWEVPRGITVQAIADLIGVSDTAVSQRLRRGTKSVMEATVVRGVWPE